MQKLKQSNITMAGENDNTTSTTHPMEEDFILGQFTSRISVSSEDQLNPGERSSTPSQDPCIATKEEAQLLMNLLSPVSRKGESYSNSIIMSPVSIYNTSSDSEFSFPFDLGEDESFSFSCPSLSLACDELNLPGPSNRTSRMIGNRHESNLIPPSPCEYNKVRRRTCNETIDLSQLLERNVSENIKTWKDVGSNATDIAKNIRNTFGFIVNSRIDTWTRSVLRVLRLKEQVKKFQSPLSSSSKQVKEHDQSKKKVLDALSSVSSKILVSNVRTTFRSLSKRNEKSNSISTMQNENIAFDGRPRSPIVSPPPKKRMRTGKNIEKDSGIITELERSLEFTATVEVEPYDLTLLLHAPGTIKGKFDPKENFSHSDRKSRLTGVEIQLDIEALVDSFRKQSRYVARKAAEIELTNAKSNERLESSLQFKETQIQGFKLETTKEENIFSNSHTMPPPPPRYTPKSLGIVSPSPGSPSLLNRKNDEIAFPVSLIAPFLSPCKTTPSLPVISYESNFNNMNQSLPALVEVACASFAAEKCLTENKESRIHRSDL